MPGVSLSAPEPLATTHEFSIFSCGEDALDSWLRKRAEKNERSGASRTYVVCEKNTVAAYYTLAVGSVEHAFTPGGIRRNMPDPIPVMVLARLAVDTQYAGMGIGTALVRDALLRTLQAANIAGIRALLVHALHEKAARFYTGLGFLASPVEPLVLFLPLEHVSAITNGEEEKRQ